MIRPYEPRDRAAVRHICFVTGYMGDPIDWQWRDAPSFADLFTCYYTDAEPESALVAEKGGDVVGYLLGCVDSRTVSIPPRVAARHLLRRGLLFRPGTAPVLWRAIADLAVDAAHRRLPTLAVIDERWPAHLHIDLLPAGRGHGAGSALVNRWLDHLRMLGVAGCHAETWAENHDAIAFFEAVGFRRHGPPAPMSGMRSPTGARHHTQLMVHETLRR